MRPTSWKIRAPRRISSSRALTPGRAGPAGALTTRSTLSWACWPEAARISWITDEGCNVVNRVSPEDAAAEQFTYAHRALEALCRAEPACTPLQPRLRESVSSRAEAQHEARGAGTRLLAERHDAAFGILFRDGVAAARGLRALRSACRTRVARRAGSRLGSCSCSGCSASRHGSRRFNHTEGSGAGPSRYAPA
jgi:hypothetical protein